MPVSAPTLRVPRAHGVVVCDGELEEVAWHDAVVSGAFTDDASHEAARPYSEARLLYDDHAINLVLYAADEDLQVPRRVSHDHDLGAFDHFVVRFETKSHELFEMQFGADGSRFDTHIGHRDWASRARVGVDRDGSVNDPSDEDEEWIIEAAIPFAALGMKAGEPCTASFSRCDRLKNGTRVCANWGGAATGPPQGTLVFGP